MTTKDRCLWCDYGMHSPLGDLPCVTGYQLKGESMKSEEDDRAYLLSRLADAEAILREVAVFSSMPVIDGKAVVTMANHAHAFLGNSATHYQWRAESRLKGIQDTVDIALEALKNDGYSAGRWCERLGITRQEGHDAGIPWLANAVTWLASRDYFKHEAKEMLR